MKDIVKACYLLVFKLRYQLVCLTTKQKDNTVLFINSYPQSCEQIKRKISPYYYQKLEFDPKITSMSKQIKMLAQAKYIFIDNYYVGLGAVKLDSKIKIQVWHANGAIKKFGLASPNTQKCSKMAIKRYTKVYQNIDHVVVSSAKMKGIVCEAFALDQSKILTTGYPKMDEYASYQYQQEVELEMQNNQETLDNIVVLYVPTFRDDEADNQAQIEFLEQLSSQVVEGIKIFYHLHPKVKFKNKQKLSNIIPVDTSKVTLYYQIANLIITDYSSVVFEASYFNKPFAFYVYDSEKYANTQGLFLTTDQLPGFKQR